MHREVQVVQRSGEVVATSKRTRSVTAVWSDDSIDHYATSFVQEGIDTSTFGKNPVILWQHGKDVLRGSLPIANATEWGIERHEGRRALIGVSRFWEDSFSNDRFEDYATGRLKGWSISALPLESSPPTPAERKAGWGGCETVFRSTRLLEVSAAPVPGNANTLTIGVERSAAGTLVADDDTTRELEQLSDEQLQALIERLHKESTAHYFRDRREGQRKRKAHAAYYEALAQQQLSQRRMSRSSLPAWKRELVLSDRARRVADAKRMLTRGW